MLTELRKVTIIGDSMVKYVSRIDGCLVQAFRENPIAKLTQGVQKNNVQLDKFDFVIYHMHTNDIGLRAKTKHSSDYANLVAVNREVNPHIKIVISAILPRPVDHKIS